MSDAITRNESLLKSIADGTSSSLKPITREEQYLAYIAGETNSFPLEPITREEAFLDKIAKNGAGGGGSSINVQPLTVTENGTFDAPEGQAYDPVIVNVASGGGAELNIAYGDTAPEDTSKLWVKTTQPSAVKVSSGLTLAPETITKLSATRTDNKKSKELCSLPIDDKIYLAGGVGGTFSNDIRYFDILTQTFGTISATLPVKDLIDCATTTFGSKFYLLGGYSYSPKSTSNSVYCLDTDTGVTTTLSATFPSARRYMGYATVGNKCYMFGGSGSEGNATIFCFDAENETLTQLSTVLPTGGTNWAASADGTIIYLITTNPSKDILAFDTETEKISVISTHTLSEGSAQRLQSYANKIYWRGYLYCLGAGYSTNSTSKYIVVNVADGTLRYSASSYTFLNQTCACSVVNDIVYVFYETEVATFKLPTDILLDTNTLQIQSASSNKFNLINTDTAQVEIGVNKVYKGNADGIAEEVEASLHNGTSWVTI